MVIGEHKKHPNTDIVAKSILFTTLITLAFLEVLEMLTTK